METLVADVTKPAVMVCVYFHLLSNVQMVDAVGREKNVAEILAADLIKHAVVEWLVVVLLKYAVTVCVYSRLLSYVQMVGVVDLGKNVVVILAAGLVKLAVME